MRYCFFFFFLFPFSKLEEDQPGDKYVSNTSLSGTWNLHELLPQDLEFFVVLSSLAGIIGSVSQSNYAAGNTFLDALVHYRRQKGMSAHSLDIGVMTGIGYVEEHDDARARTSHLRVVSLCMFFYKN